MTTEKYKKVFKPNHSNATTNGFVREHVLIASSVLGKTIPKGVHIHHVDLNGKNNNHSNLVICSAQYHRILHARTRALDISGDANKMKCAHCGEYDDPDSMYVRKDQYQAWHRDCANKSKRVNNPKTGPYCKGGGQ
jgi:hypothetical protein